MTLTTRISKHILLLLTSALLLYACGGRPTAFDIHGKKGALQAQGYYTVQPGDTLFGIAWKHGVDMDDLAEWNAIRNPDRILAGTRLRLEPPAGVAPPKITTPNITTNGQKGWQWPTRGTVSNQRSVLKGIRILGKKGQAIRAANDGVVVYSGAGLTGLGRVIVIRHGEKIFSAYGYLEQVNIKEKQHVKKGQLIATMGISPQSQPALYFEIRNQGQSVSPYAYIGSRQR